MLHRPPKATSILVCCLMRHAVPEQRNRLTMEAPATWMGGSCLKIASVQRK